MPKDRGWQKADQHCTVITQLPALANMLGGLLRSQQLETQCACLHRHHEPTCCYFIFMGSARTPELLRLRLKSVRCTCWHERGSPCPQPCAARRQALRARPQSCKFLLLAALRLAVLAEYYLLTRLQCSTGCFRERRR